MKVFPVVHIKKPEIAIQQAQLALGAGADGVYLIDHKGNRTTTELFETFNGVVEGYPNAYVGINILGLPPPQACMVVERAFRDGTLKSVPDGLWADDALNESQYGETKKFKQTLKDLSGMRYLGGVAFKYTPEFTEDPQRAYQEALDAQGRVDVVITSGAGTGTPPTVAKIKSMKQAVGANGVLAVASGISLENLNDYADIVDEVLLASSIETKPYSGIFDMNKLETFITKAHQQ